MTKGLFITGTGTEVGKTYVSALLVKKCQDYGQLAGYFKAVLSGDDGSDKVDHRYVANIAGLTEIPEIPFLYKTPVSPHLASQLEGNFVDLETILTSYKIAEDQCDFMTVEGSGGIICPLRYDETEQLYLTDVVQALNLPVLVVADSGLGTINATALTVEYMKSKNIEVRGIIFNRFQSGNLLHEDNKRMVTAITGIPVVATVAEEDDTLHISAQRLKSLYRKRRKS